LATGRDAKSDSISLGAVGGAERNAAKRIVAPMKPALKGLSLALSLLAVTPALAEQTTPAVLEGLTVEALRAAFGPPSSAQTDGKRQTLYYQGTTGTVKIYVVDGKVVGTDTIDAAAQLKTARTRRGQTPAPRSDRPTRFVDTRPARTLTPAPASNTPTRPAGPHRWSSGASSEASRPAAALPQHLITNADATPTLEEALARLHETFGFATIIALGFFVIVIFGEFITWARTSVIALFTIPSVVILLIGLGTAFVFDVGDTRAQVMETWARLSIPSIPTLVACGIAAVITYGVILGVKALRKSDLKKHSTHIA
jgi:hypothetical protein